MIIRSAEFKISSPSLKLCPKTKLPEYAFIGRSNVGKSSLINMLVNRTHLAKTSVKPGKTRLINYFLINGNWYMVDLPGYGYASASKAEITKWGNLIDEYLMKQKNLSYLFVLVDSRLKPQKIDIDFINNLGFNRIPFVIVSTKIDKISKLQITNHIKLYNKELEKTWDELPIHLLSSSKTSQGRNEILYLIENTNNEWQI